MNSGTDTSKAAKLIREGKLVAFPTETVYGLGADALNPLAVAKIFESKERPSFDPLIVHIADFETLAKLVLNTEPRIRILAKQFWPGPLTIVMKKSDLVPDIVTSGLDTVAVRMPDSKWALQLIRESGRPIAAPSANKFGKLSPTRAEHVIKAFNKVDYILDGGETTVGIESTIIRLTDKGFVILRPGVITKEDIEPHVSFDYEFVSGQELEAPGMMHSHYSPDKPLYFEEDFKLAGFEPSKAAYLSFTGSDINAYGHTISMAADGDLRKYAVKMFAVIHELQDSEYSYIVVEALPEEGVGIAIMDRLKKAAYRYKKHLKDSK